ncbi:MAG TPA: acetyl-CoA hydrolase/transferase C-terminal domain-containing protein [Thermodesulfobacteriota bacterium]|nr:acetyl-CoA hydrolase/transferase C-terminal domain-containing protein [Thermodesulfobacteriota bacterium]
MKYNYQKVYQDKLTTPQMVVEKLRSGNHIFYGEFVLFPEVLDQALYQRMASGSLKDVVIESVCLTRPPAVTKDPALKGLFQIEDWHFGAISRNLYGAGIAAYKPITYHQGPRIIRKYRDYDAIFLPTTPMGPKGNFNYGVSNSITSAILDKAKMIVVEVNSSIPKCLGGNQESIHISRVTHVVEGNNTPLAQVMPAEPTEVETQIAQHLIKEIEDGACLQLGIGGLPNVIGEMLAESDLKDLGLHTEMMVDSCVNLYERGRITGARKLIDKYKMVYTFALGTQKLYDFLDDNPVCASFPVNYVNDPRRICVNPKVVAINNAVEVDLFSQVASETVGPRHITGTGGQLDFIFGAFNSEGGKGIISLSSTHTTRTGKWKSRIVPTLSTGSVVTVPRSIVQYVATEYGVVQLKGKSTWERAEALIGIAHPNFRDALIKDAEKLGIWRRSNRLAA